MNKDFYHKNKNNNKMKKENKLKTREQFLTRGEGNFINCTDYEDALKAMQEYADQETKVLQEKLDAVKNLSFVWFQLNDDYEALRTVARGMAEGLEHSKQQIEYLHDKFKKTGSGNTVLSIINRAIDSYNRLINKT